MSKDFLRISLGVMVGIALVMTTGCGDTSDSGYRPPVGRRSTTPDFSRESMGGRWYRPPLVHRSGR